MLLCGCAIDSIESNLAAQRKTPVLDTLSLVDAISSYQQQLLQIVVAKQSSSCLEREVVNWLMRGCNIFGLGT